MVSKVFKEKFDEGETAWPQAVLDRFVWHHPRPLQSNERYMGTDWSASDNCQTFTFNTIARAAYLANERHDISPKAMSQVETLVSVATQSCLQLKPSGILNMLRQYAQRLNWVSESTVLKSDAEGAGKQ